MAKKNRGFELWFNENKESEDLQDRYASCCEDMKQLGEKSPSFKRWMQSVYDDDPDIQSSDSDCDPAGCW